MMRKQRYDSIWDAIEPSRAEAANMKARAATMIAIQRAVAKWRLTQAATAKRLGLTQPRLNDLLRGRINKFSLGALVTIAMAAGLEVRVAVVKAA
jgi:predicted XRE-type DNA-binding protein